MSNSSLISYRRISPCKTSPRNHKIDSVAIHCMAGNLSVETCGSLFANRSRQASSNYGIGSDGRIALYVDEKDRSWCTSSAAVDNRAVTIEVANTTASEPFRISDKAYASLLNLLTDICRRNGISSLKWKGSKSLALSFNVAQQNMFVHRWFANKSCPGNYLYSIHADIAKEVNRRLAGGIPITSVPTGNIVDETTAAVNVDYTRYNPYVVTVDRNSPGFSYTTLKSAGVVGAMIEAGYLYNTVHQEVTFKNPKIDSQVKAAADAKIPFGLYMTARARTTAEAEKELYQLSFLIRKYPPALGVWLRLELVKSTSINNTIIDYYYKELVRLGLIGRVGFYVTESQLQKIDWNKYQKDWYLWIDKHVTSTSELNRLMDPEFFDM